MSYDLAKVSERLRTQDNRCTCDPMFCVQILVRKSGFDSDYSDNLCWWNPGKMEVAYDDEPEGEGWDGPYGYKDRWETKMVAYTEEGCQEYLALDGHNLKRQAHNGEVRIFVDSFHRCPEMIAIREMLMAKGGAA